jgi:hypothetical protein
VSVIVPCYNYGHLLPACLGSVLDQQGVSVEVLVIDDASPDGSGERAQASTADPRVEVVRHRRNTGHLATYNEGLAWARGDYTVLLSADDLLTPGALARATALMETIPAVGFVYGHAPYLRDAKETPTARTGPVRWRIWQGEQWIAGRCRAGVNVISSPEVVVRTAVQRAAGGYSLRLPHSGDLEMWLRLAALGDVGFVGGADQAFYRVHAESMLRTRFDSKLADLTQRREAFRVFFEDHPDLAAGPKLARAVERRLAKQAVWEASRAYDRGRVATVPVDALVDFAIETDPGVLRTPAAAGLRWRRAVGPSVAKVLQPIALPAVVRALRNRLWWRTWQWRGV